MDWSKDLVIAEHLEIDISTEKYLNEDTFIIFTHNNYSFRSKFVIYVV